jgi:hypothetical protein
MGGCAPHACSSARAPGRGPDGAATGGTRGGDLEKSTALREARGFLSPAASLAVPRGRAHNPLIQPRAWAPQIRCNRRTLRQGVDLRSEPAPFCPPARCSNRAATRGFVARAMTRSRRRKGCQMSIVSLQPRLRPPLAGSGYRNGPASCRGAEALHRWVQHRRSRALDDPGCPVGRFAGCVWGGRRRAVCGRSGSRFVRARQRGAVGSRVGQGGPCVRHAAADPGVARGIVGRVSDRSDPDAGPNLLTPRTSRIASARLALPSRPPIRRAVKVDQAVPGLAVRLCVGGARTGGPHAERTGRGPAVTSNFYTRRDNPGSLPLDDLEEGGP